MALALLALLGEGVMRLMRRLPSPSYVPARLALSAITRQGSPLRAIIIAFGLGLSVLVAVTLTRHNLDQQITNRVADKAPDWFSLIFNQIKLRDLMKSRADSWYLRCAKDTYVTC